MAIKYLPNISRNLPCDVATLQSLLDNATSLLENHQKGINEVWATDHTPPFLRYGGFLKLEGADSVSFSDKYRLHPREEFTIIFKNFTREHIDSAFWLVLGQTTSSATLSLSIEEPFADNPGEILVKTSDGTTTISAVSSGFDLRHHEIIELGIVYNGSTISFYKNGVFINSVAATTLPINYVGNMYIGGDHAGVNEINGYLRDWIFWGKAFSSAEILTYYGNHSDPYPDELRISLDFDEATGTVITDSADPTKWGIEFDDLTDTTIEHYEELILIDNFTILGEIYWHENSYTENVILAKGSEFEGHCNYRVAVEKATKKLKFSYYSGTTWTHVTSNLTVRAGHYCNFGIRVTGGAVDFYIDQTWDSQALSVNLRSDYNSFVFGYDKNLISPKNRWHGHIRNVGIFPDVLTDIEVDNYFSGTTPTSVTSYWTLRNGSGNTFVSTAEHNVNDFGNNTDSFISHNVMQQTPVEGSWLVQIYLTDLSLISTYADIFMKGNGGTTIDYQLQVSSTGKIVFRTKNPNINNIISTLTVTENKWYELFITIRRQWVSIRMNGINYNAAITDAIRIPSTNSVALGVFSADAFPGYIKKFMQWDRALRYEEWDKLLYERVVPTTGLAIDLAIDEGSGSTFNDDSTDYRLDI